MAETAVLLNIGEMIDLAIGTPEVGTVDFNMLQTVLHCLAQQLRVLNKNVELKVSGTAIAMAAVPNDLGQTINIEEFVVDTEADAATEDEEVYREAEQLAHEAKSSRQFTDLNKFTLKCMDPNKPKLVKKGVLSASAPHGPGYTDPNTLLVVERVKKSDSKKGGQPATTARQSVPGGGAAKSASMDKLSLVTTSKFNLLENIVEDLKNRVYGSLPKNEDMLEEVRSSTNLKAITDMWTNLNVSSRLEAAETGLGKLSSLVQDLIAQTHLQVPTTRETTDSTAAGMVGPAGPPGPQGPPGPPGPPGRDASGMAAAAAAPVAAAPEVAGAPGMPCQPGDAADLRKIQDFINQMRGDVDNLITVVNDIDSFAEGLGGGPEESPGGGAGSLEGSETNLPAGQKSRASTVSRARPSTAAAAQASAILRRRALMPKVYSKSGVDLTPLMNQLNGLEQRLKECCESHHKGGGLIDDQLTSFQDQLDQLHKDVGTLITSSYDSGQISPDLIKDLQGLMALFKTVQDMQEQLNKVHETALQLASEKDGRAAHMNALLEQIELLKIVKLDREDMIEAMADKADLRMLARKVSHDQFESACDDLSRGLEHAIAKLGMQEALWQQVLDDIQREIETKLDKMELSPVKEFFNQKLRQLQENLKAIAAMRREVEAAGTKRKLLRDVNCISCDAQAVMPMEPNVVATSKPLPPSMSMKPYLTYELDTIRKQQAAGGGSQRNMNDWETIDKQMGQAKPSAARARSATDKHLCNRYCGGSHTVTTPAQRVARTGHFIRQWGPEVLPLSSGMAAGDDGRLYKISVEAEKASPGAPPECTPRKSEARKSDAKPPGRPITISAECRCLEGEKPK